MRKRVLYLSRGRGYGHAAADIEIVHRLREHLGANHVIAASYGDGLKVWRAAAEAVEDIGVQLDAEMSPEKIVPVMYELIGATRPDLVITHEVFFALPAARARGVPSIILTHWFFSELEAAGGLGGLDTVLALADRILVMDLEELHVVPPIAAGKVQFIGPVVRDAFYRFAEPRPTLDNGFRILITMGGCTKPQDCSRITAVLDACQELMERDLVTEVDVVAPGLADTLRATVRGACGVHVYDMRQDMAEMASIADLVIGRGSFGTLCELAVLGVPSLHLMDADNPVDLLHVRQLAHRGMVRWLPWRTEQMLTTAVEEAALWARAHRGEVIAMSAAYRSMRGGDSVVAEAFRFMGT